MSPIQLNVRAEELKSLLFIGEFADIEILGISTAGTPMIWKRCTFIIYEQLECNGSLFPSLMRVKQTNQRAIPISNSKKRRELAARI
jgi:hypothetical protein